MLVVGFCIEATLVVVVVSVDIDVYMRPLLAASSKRQTTGTTTVRRLERASERQVDVCSLIGSHL